jgi:Type II secretion system (T2SS), protein M subtype b
VAVALGVGATAALVVGLLLASLSAPKDFDARTAALQQQADRAQALLKPVRDKGPFGPEALCTAEPGRQAQTLSDRLSAEAAQAQLVVDSLDARPEPAPDFSARVTPVRLRFSVTGSYEGAVGLLALLARERPQLFVDSLDLTPKVSNVTLSFSGRVFCGA